MTDSSTQVITKRLGVAAMKLGAAHLVVKNSGHLIEFTVKNLFFRLD